MSSDLDKGALNLKTEEKVKNVVTDIGNSIQKWGLNIGRYWNQYRTHITLLRNKKKKALV